MAIISASNANLYDARIKEVVFNNLNAHPEEYTKWCDKRSSKDQYEELALFGELPMPPVLGEYENAAETTFKPGPMRKWTHVQYGYTLIASKIAIEDSRFPVIVQTAGSMGKAMKHRIETQGVYDLNSAFSVYTVGASDTADEYLCQSAHATFTGAGGSSQKNREATDATLGVDSLWTGVNNFATLKDHEGNPVIAIPKTLIIPPALERKAIEILKSSETPFLSTNETNAIRTRDLGYVVSHYMTSTTAWFLVTDEKPIRFYMRRPVTVEPDETIRNQSRSWTITCRLSHAPYDWYQIYGSDGVA